MKGARKMDLPLVSVIVPIYNVEKYLHDCINSIICQSYEKLEIILVDDGSTDSSPEIADSFSDTRIRVYHRQNGGVLKARNFGVDNANGDFLAFVDADDTIAKDYIKFLVENALKNNADISICISNTISDSDHCVKDWQGEYSVQVCEKDEGIIHLLKADEFGCGINKLYKKEVWRKYRIDETIRINEDLFMNYFCFTESNLIVFSNARLYNYRHRNGSASRSGFDERQLDAVRVNEMIARHAFCQSNELVRSAAANRFAGVLWSVYKGMTKNSMERGKAEVIEVMERNAEILKNSGVNPKYKMLLWSIKNIRGMLDAIL